MVYVGCLLGAFAAMMLSRYLFREMVVAKVKKSKWLSDNFEAINEILKERGATSVFMLRLTFFPFGTASTVLGVTEISSSNFMIGTTSYLINCLMQVFIGSQLYHI